MDVSGLFNEDGVHGDDANGGESSADSGAVMNDDMLEFDWKVYMTHLISTKR